MTTACTAGDVLAEKAFHEVLCRKFSSRDLCTRFFGDQGIVLSVVLGQAPGDARLWACENAGEQGCRLWTSPLNVVTAIDHFGTIGIKIEDGDSSEREDSYRQLAELFADNFAKSTIALSTAVPKDPVTLHITYKPLTNQIGEIKFKLVQENVDKGVWDMLSNMTEIPVSGAGAGVSAFPLPEKKRKGPGA